MTRSERRASDASPKDPLAALGWDSAWQVELERHVAARVRARGDFRLVPARVIAQHRDRWIVRDAEAERPAVVAGALRHHAAGPDALPAVGDWVMLSVGEGLARIESVLPRRGALRRRAAGEALEAQLVAANVDLALIVAGLVPEPNVRRIERSLAIAWDGGAVPLVVLTKSDLHEDPENAAASLRAALPGADVVAISSTTGAGLDALTTWLRSGRTAVLLGPSGAGKSTLINRLLGEERLRTNEVREDGRGRHTTTHRELITLPDGALLIDTPGTRELGLWMDEEGLAATFEDIDTLAAGCRFADCAHDTEPGCAVRAAVDAGMLASDRVEHWRKLQRELDWVERKHDPAAAAQWEARVRAQMRGVREWLRKKRGEGGSGS